MWLQGREEIGEHLLALEERRGTQVEIFQIEQIEYVEDQLATVEPARPIAALARASGRAVATLPAAATRSPASHASRESID